MVEKVIFLSVILLLAFPALAWSDDFSLGGYVEMGKKSTAEDYEEEDTDDDYAYRNYHLQFEQRISSRLNYDLSSFLYNKDYQSKDSLDNISRIFKTSWSYQIKKSKERSLELGLGLRYKQKRYHNSPKDEYDQLVFSPSLTYEKENLYRMDLDLGVDDFEYSKEENKDQTNFFGRIGGKRYLANKRLMLISTYRIEEARQKRINRGRIKHEITAGLDYVPRTALVRQITIRGSWGSRDTKEDDQRDQDYDYRYWQYYVKAEQEVGPKLDTYLKYQYFKKDYVASDLDHSGFLALGGLDYSIIETGKQKVWLEAELEFKHVDYTQKASGDYDKSRVEVGLSYQKKKDFKVSSRLQVNDYQYSCLSNDKKRYYWLFSGEKMLEDGHLVLSVDFKYRYTDYRQKYDGEQTGLRSTLEYRF